MPIVDQILNFYGANWAIALGALPSTSGWVMVAGLLAAPCLIVFGIGLALWQPANALSGDRMAAKAVTTGTTSNLGAVLLVGAAVAVAAIGMSAGGR